MQAVAGPHHSGLAIVCVVASLPAQIFYREAHGGCIRVESLAPGFSGDRSGFGNSQLRLGVFPERNRPSSTCEPTNPGKSMLGYRNRLIAMPRLVNTKAAAILTLAKKVPMTMAPVSETAPAEYDGSVMQKACAAILRAACYTLSGRE